MKSKNGKLKNEIEISKQNHEEIITEMEKKIDALKSKISFGEMDLGKSITVVFQSADDMKVDCPIKCKSKQFFWEIEDLLYEEFPQYKKNKNYFLAFVIVVDTYKTVEENKIRGGSVVIVCRRDLD